MKMDWLPFHTIPQYGCIIVYHGSVTVTYPLVSSWISMNMVFLPISSWICLWSTSCCRNTIMRFWLEYSCCLTNGGFLKLWYPQIIHFNGIFHYKPSISGFFPWFSCGFRMVWGSPLKHSKGTNFPSDGSPISIFLLVWKNIYLEDHSSVFIPGGS